ETLAQPVLEGPSGPRRVLYPVDPGSQGTWVGMSERGTSYGLLNQHPEGWQRRRGLQSRGRLVPLALAADTAIAGLERVASENLADTAPFLLVGVDEGQAPLSLRWDGRELERRLYPEGPGLWTSSAFEPKAVDAARQELFQCRLSALPRNAEDADVLALQEAFHFSQEPEAGPWAVWMTRDDARSVSYTHLMMLQKQGVLRYLDRKAKDQGEAPLVIALARSIP
ncbi:MAG TPA: NRDE family protein, partial [bacterium]|nr:NRDE family protein [bacterium]